MLETYQNIALIVAAGNGTRTSQTLPKQYVDIAGKTILQRAIEIFRYHAIDKIVVVINQNHLKLFEQLPKDIQEEFCFGGETRQESVRLGLEYLSKYQPKNVLIHDAARIFCKQQQINELLNFLEHNIATCLVRPIKDTLRYINEDKWQTIPREHIYAVQTPQAFNYQHILALHQQFSHIDVSDDIAMLEQNEISKIHFINNTSYNSKITTDEDIIIAKTLLGDR